MVVQRRFKECKVQVNDTAEGKCKRTMNSGCVEVKTEDSKRILGYDVVVFREGSTGLSTLVVA
jgi:hypothetical protein